jgi:predicted nucleic acid-binding Zn ribbon protein
MNLSIYEANSPIKLSYIPRVPLDPAIKSLITHFRKSKEWDEHLDLELLQKLWPTLVGEQLANVTRITAIHGSTAVLDVPDVVWRKQLYRMKGKLLHRINELWSTQHITEIAITYENH